MKIYSVIEKEGLPHLRIKNPLAGSTLISRDTFEEHERQYVKEAVRLIDSIHGQSEYLETEIRLIWRFNDGGRWIDLSGEPSFIDTKPDQYEQVFKPFVNGRIYQQRVNDWLKETFGDEEANGKRQRLVKFFEEAAELAQACGMLKEEALRIIIDKFNAAPGDTAKETADVLVTLAGLCHVNGLDMDKTRENGLSSNAQRSADIKLKWLLRQQTLTL